MHTCLHVHTHAWVPSDDRQAAVPCVRSRRKKRKRKKVMNDGQEVKDA